MELAELKGAVSIVLAQLKDSGEVNESHSELVTANIDTITEIVAELEHVFGDGLQWSDVTGLGECVAPIMKLASGFDELEGQDRKDFVIEVVWLAYKTVDGYPDGTKNNVNLPWIGGAFETKVEKTVIKFAASFAVDALYKRMKDEGEV